MLVHELTEDQMQQIISDWNRFEHDGFIGDCLLRKTAKEEIDKVGMEGSRVTTIMRDIAFEVFRRKTFDLEAELDRIKSYSMDVF